jgi:2-deoxy-D-gluconate 3-dehydrogenase
VVTGGGRGLGRAAALALADAGAEVALLARSREQIEAGAQAIAAHHGRAIAVQCDVADEQSVARAARTVVDRLGRVDVLINNAGVAPVAPLLDLDLADLRYTLEVNVIGTFVCAREFGAQMVAQGSGRVINIASIAGLSGEAELTAYCATKGAVIAFTRALALEWARHGVTVNAIAPGYFRTDLNREAIDDAKVGAKILEHIPLRRVGKPEEIGPLVVYLASDAAAFMTGSVIVLDGGQLAR